MRLALWRMESQLAPLVAQESARPHYLYSRSFPARLVATLPANRPELTDVPIVSPLASPSLPYVRLHFQWDAEGRLSSPRLPGTEGWRGADRGTRESLAAAGRLASPAALLTMLSAEWIQVEPASRIAVPAQPQALEARRQAELRQKLTKSQADEPQQRAAEGSEQSAAKQQALSKLEFYARSASNTANIDMQSVVPPAPPASYGTAEVRVGRLQPVWASGELLLARRVRVGARELVQVCWLDWPALRSWLLASVSDLLPAAELAPVAAGDEDETRRLAALPVRLLPGKVAQDLGSSSSGLRLPLTAAWALAFVSLAASAALLFGMATLSERRAAFVSAVTHELRTPLTTFRIYSDMLLEGMVEGEEQRRQYLATLSREAERQSHLVENVLAYSRLERGRYTAAREGVTVEELLASVSRSLVAHAEQSRMSLALSIPDDVRGLSVRVDRSAVERILFNLVDNACKYARDASDRRIHLDCAGEARAVRFTVSDHGPGIDAREARRLFRPFHKSARDAAQSAPGVGLGLALSRRLAQAIGGELRAVRTGAGGAAFCLRLPREAGGGPPAQPA